MTHTFGQQKFLESEEGKWLRKELIKMDKSPDYNTEPIYTTLDSSRYGFVERKLDYMSRFPNMNHRQYLSNLKLMSRIKR